MYAVSECSSATRAGRCTLRICQPRRRGPSAVGRDHVVAPRIVAVVAVRAQVRRHSRSRRPAADGRRSGRSPRSRRARAARRARSRLRCRSAAQPFEVRHHVGLAGERDALPAGAQIFAERHLARSTAARGSRSRRGSTRSGRCSSSCATGRRRPTDVGAARSARRGAPASRGSACAVRMAGARQVVARSWSHMMNRIFLTLPTKVLIRRPRRRRTI